MEQSDVPRGSRGGHVEAGLLQSARLVHGPGEGPDTAGQHEELVDDLVLQVVVWTPHQLLQLLTPPPVHLRLDDLGQKVTLITGANLDLSSVLEQLLILLVVDQRIEEGVLLLDVGKQGLCLV